MHKFHELTEKICGLKFKSSEDIEAAVITWLYPKVKELADNFNIYDREVQRILGLEPEKSEAKKHNHATELCYEGCGWTGGKPEESKCYVYYCHNCGNDKQFCSCVKVSKESKPKEQTWPCSKCGKGMTKAEGGTTFSVCESCWDKPKEKTMGWYMEHIAGENIEKGDLVILKESKVYKLRPKQKELRETLAEAMFKKNYGYPMLKDSDKAHWLSMADVSLQTIAEWEGKRE